MVLHTFSRRPAANHQDNLHGRLCTLALAASAVSALPQAVTSNISPSSPAPEGCKPSYDGTFQITVVNVTTSGGAKVKRQAGPLELTLSDSVLKDAKDRTGYIASNYQFQFDGPPQVSFIHFAANPFQAVQRDIWWR